MTDQTDWGQPLVDSLNQHTLREQQEQIKEKPKRFQFIFSLKEKHEGYFTVVLNISVAIGFLYGFIKLLNVIFNAIRSNDFGTFVFVILFNSPLTMLWGLIAGIVVFVGLVVVTFIPYLIVRGFAK